MLATRRLQPPEACPRSPRAARRGSTQVTTLDYRQPGQLRRGRRAGRRRLGHRPADRRRAAALAAARSPLAVGEHVRMPRTYRGRDIMWWLDADRACSTSATTRSTTSSAPATCPRRSSSARRSARDLDLNALTRARASSSSAGSRRSATARALLRLAAQRLRARRPQAGPAARHDRRLGRRGRRRRRRGSPQRFEPTRVPDAPRLDVDLVAGGYDTVLWATGFRPDYSWLDVPVLDRKGELRHDGGDRARRAGPVPDRAALPAPPQVELHPRRRGRRRRTSSSTSSGTSTKETRVFPINFV